MTAAAPEPNGPKAQQTAEDIKAQLRSLEKTFAAAEPDEGRTNWPDGQYQVRIKMCSVGVVASGKNQGAKKVMWIFSGAVGKMQGKTYPMSIPLKDAAAMGRVKGVFKRLGLPYATLGDIADSCIKCKGMLLEVKLRTTDQGSQFCDVLNVLTKDEEESIAGEVAKTAEDKASANEIDKLIDELDD